VRQATIAQSERPYWPWARHLDWITAALVLTMLIAGQRFRLNLPKAEHNYSLRCTRRRA
jgi:hypothetical protein